MISDILHSGGLSWIDLIELWIRDTPGKTAGARSQEKAGMVLDLIFNKPDMLELFSGTAGFAEKVTTSAAKVIRSELGRLSEEAQLFGKYSHEVEPSELDFGQIAETVSLHAPNLYQLLETASARQRGKDPPRKAEQGRGYVTLITSVLNARRAPRTANFFTRSLGLYLDTCNVPRRALSVLHDLGAIDSYSTLYRESHRIAEHSKGRN